MNTGPLTRSIKSLQLETHSIGTIIGLPADMHAIQTQAITTLGAAISEIRGVQTSATSFVPASRSDLESALTKLNSNDLTGAITILENLKVRAENAKSQLNGHVGKIGADEDQITGFARALGAKVASLAAQQRSLQKQVADKVGEAAALKKKERYLIALGPFGLDGIAIAIAAYEKIQKEVNEIESHAADSARQLSSVNATHRSVETLHTGLTAVVTMLTNLSHALEFLANDLGNQIGNIAHSKDGLTLAKVLVHASLSELVTIETDAS